MNFLLSSTWLDMQAKVSKGRDWEAIINLNLEGDQLVSWRWCLPRSLVPSFHSPLLTTSSSIFLFLLSLSSLHHSNNPSHHLSATQLSNSSYPSRSHSTHPLTHRNNSKTPTQQHTNTTTHQNQQQQTSTCSQQHAHSTAPPASWAE